MKSLSHRRFAAGLALIAASALVLSGCSSEDKNADDTTKTTVTTAEASKDAKDSDAEKTNDKETATTEKKADKADKSDKASSGDITVESIYGPVTLEKPAERVVALSPQHAAILVSLGVQPVALGFTEEDLEANSPWLVGKFTGKFDPELAGQSGGVDVNLEKAATYEPDLITGWTFQISEDAAKQAEAIAPAFAGLPDEGLNPAWDITTEALGKLTGKDAQKVIDEAHETCKKAAAEVPEWEGKTYAFNRPNDQGLQLGGQGAFECFGLKPMANHDMGRVVSYENLDEIDSDFLAMFDVNNKRAQIEADPRFSELPASKHNAVIWFDSMALGTAINVPDPYTWDYLADEILPALKEANL